MSTPTSMPAEHIYLHAPLMVKYEIVMKKQTVQFFTWTRNCPFFFHYIHMTLKIDSALPVSDLLLFHLLRVA